MARAKKSGDGGDGIAIKPVLLAAVLALLWVALVPSGASDVGAPEWAAPAVVATRFLAGFVAGWVVISLAQIVLRILALGAAQLSVPPRRR
ncbi:MAG TPA: hypothetical protein VN632_05305 [Stellaceae bacterium]|nr:hypothetical protein [Stellaceae bacterium]